jgi:hypothetical protein
MSSKDQDLISLTMNIIDEPLKHYKADADGVFREVKQLNNHNFDEYIKNIDAQDFEIDIRVK